MGGEIELAKDHGSQAISPELGEILTYGVPKGELVMIKSRAGLYAVTPEDEDAFMEDLRARAGL